jgi:hypothetical protein
MLSCWNINADERPNFELILGKIAALQKESELEPEIVPIESKREEPLYN